MKKKILAVALAVITLSSCDDFLDINKNPNQTTISTPELVLAGALNTTAGQLFPNQMGAMWAGQWAPSGDVSGFVQEKTYDFNNTYGTGIWTNYYDILNDYKYVMTEAAAVGGKATAAAIAKIMSVYCYHKLVDTYNNVPYTDALQGTDLIRPSYDAGQSIYEAIIDDLDEAVAELKAAEAGDTPGAADIVFGGDKNNWIRFANTLKLRLLIRQSEMPGRDAYITGEIAEMTSQANFATVNFLTTDANSAPGYLKTAGKQNPFWDNYFLSENSSLRNNYNFYRTSAFTASLLPSSDERKFYIIGPISTKVDTFPSEYVTKTASRYKGVTYGDESSAAYSNVTSGIGFGILKALDMPMTIFTAAESYFLQSEAIHRGWLPGGEAAAETAYDNGIRASYALLGVPDPDKSTAVNESAETYITDIAPYDGTLETIIEQKYIASVGYNGFEAWSDYRRLGMPDVPISTKAIKDNIPVRLYYPNQELQTNAANVALQGTIDHQNTRVFWDAN
jgi:hypothetical protein